MKATLPRRGRLVSRALMSAGRRRSMSFRWPARPRPTRATRNDDILIRFFRRESVQAEDEDRHGHEHPRRLWGAPGPEGDGVLGRGVPRAPGPRPPRDGRAGARSPPAPPPAERLLPHRVPDAGLRLVQLPDPAA